MLCSDYRKHEHKIGYNVQIPRDVTLCKRFIYYMHYNLITILYTKREGH